MIETMTWARSSSMRALRCCGIGAVVAGLLHCASISAQTASGPALAPVKPVTAFRIFPSLLDRPPVSILPETMQLLTRAETPTTVHKGDWGVSNGNGRTAASFGPVARWTDDWPVLRDPSRRDDIFDPLKFISLNGSKSIDLTLSLDERPRNWFENRPFLGKQKHDDSGHITVRGLYDADRHLGKHFASRASSKPNRSCSAPGRA